MWEEVEDYIPTNANFFNRTLTRRALCWYRNDLIRSPGRRTMDLTMPHSPSIIANAFLHASQARGIKLDHLKLQKLVFFAHAWSLALHGQSVVDERPQAWTFGPVFDSIYQRLGGTKGRVTQLLKTFNPSSGKHEGLIPAPNETPVWDMVHQVLERYGHLTAQDMSALGHEPDGPWDAARTMALLSIPDETIIARYRQKLDAYAADPAQP